MRQSWNPFRKDPIRPVLQAEFRDLFAKDGKVSWFVRLLQWITLLGPWGWQVIRSAEGDSVYMIRTYLTPMWLPIRCYLHQIRRSDEARDPHNHPWNVAVSLLLSGGYYETRFFIDRDYLAVGRHIEAPALNKIGVDTFHRIDLIDERPVWSLFFVGRRTRDWGFRTSSGIYVPWQDYNAVTKGSRDVQG